MSVLERTTGEPAQAGLVEVTTVYEPLAGAQHLLLVGGLLGIPEESLATTVAGSLLPGVRNVLRIPGLIEIELPSLEGLRGEEWVDERGRLLGRAYPLPGIHVWANNLLRMQDSPEYVESALAGICREAAMQFGHLVSGELVRQREPYGFSGHAMAGEVGKGEVAIPRAFARAILRAWGLPDEDPTLLSGADVWVTRYPHGNRRGTQRLTLRIFPGSGACLVVHPEVLKLDFLGDEDGDILYASLVGDLASLPAEPLPMLARPWRIDPGRAQAERAPLSVEELSAMELPNLRDPEARVGLAADALLKDTVAAFVSSFVWRVPRVNALCGDPVQEAYGAGYDALEFWIEGALDARKGGEFAGRTELVLEIADQLLAGTPDMGLMQRLSPPQQAQEPLRQALSRSGGNLREFLRSYPVTALIGSVRQREALQVMDSLLAAGVEPESALSAVKADLACQSPIVAAPGDSIPAES